MCGWHWSQDTVATGSMTAPQLEQGLPMSSAMTQLLLEERRKLDELLQRFFAELQSCIQEVERHGPPKTHTCCDQRKIAEDELTTANNSTVICKSEELEKYLREVDRLERINAALEQEVDHFKQTLLTEQQLHWQSRELSKRIKFLEEETATLRDLLSYQRRKSAEKLQLSGEPLLAEVVISRYAHKMRGLRVALREAQREGQDTADKAEGVRRLWLEHLKVNRLLTEYVDNPNTGRRRHESKRSSPSRSGDTSPPHSKPQLLKLLRAKEEDPYLKKLRQEVQALRASNDVEIRWAVTEKDELEKELALLHRQQMEAQTDIAAIDVKQESLNVEFTTLLAKLEKRMALMDETFGGQQRDQEKPQPRIRKRYSLS